MSGNLGSFVISSTGNSLFVKFESDESMNYGYTGFLATIQYGNPYLNIKYNIKNIVGMLLKWKFNCNTLSLVNCATASNGNDEFCFCNICFENEGDCDSNDECQDGLSCGSNNCLASFGFDSEVDCCYIPTVCNFLNFMNNLKNSQSATVTGWMFDLDSGPWNYGNIGTCGDASWFGWKTGAAIGTISTILYGNGNASLTFGNCWNTGQVKLFLDGNEISSASSNSLITSEFEFKDSNIRFEEHNTAIIRFDDFEIQECDADNCAIVNIGEIGFCHCDICSENEGDCDSNNECLEDLFCGSNNCPASLGFDSEVDCCYQPILGDENFCSSGSPCGEDEGDCNSNDECQAGLDCGSDNCPASLGFDSEIDCCFFNDNPCDDTCYMESWKGDGACDDGNNNCGCEWDGGDCCGENVNTQFCSACECLDPNAISGNLYLNIKYYLLQKHCIVL